MNAKSRRSEWGDLWLIRPKECQQYHFGSFGIITNHTGLTGPEILFTENYPQDDRKYGVSKQCPPNQFVLLLQKWNGQEVRTQQGQIPKAVQDDWVKTKNRIQRKVKKSSCKSTQYDPIMLTCQIHDSSPLVNY